MQNKIIDRFRLNYIVSFKTNLRRFEAKDSAVRQRQLSGYKSRFTARTRQHVTVDVC